MLRVEDGDNSHYIYIKHVERLLHLHHYLKDKDSRFCPMCNNSIKLDKYENHISLCYNIAINSNTDRSIVVLPKPETYIR